MNLLFPLLVATFYGLTNFIDKFLIENRVRNAASLAVLTGIIASLVGVAILAVTGFKPIGLRDLFLILGSGVFLIIYLLPYFRALEFEETSRIVPLFQFIQVFQLVFSYLFLGETISAIQFLGFAVIFTGAAALTGEGDSLKAFKLRKSFFLMLLSSMLYSMVLIIFKFVAAGNDFWATYGYQHLGMILGSLVILAMPGFRKQFFSDIRQIKPNTIGVVGVNDTLAAIAQAIFSFAVLTAPVALVTVAANGFQPIIVLIYGAIASTFIPKYFKEDLSIPKLTSKLGGIAVIVIGLFLINR